MINKFKAICILIVAAAVIFLSASTADAHKIKIFAAGKDKNINGKAYFSGGGGVINGTVVISAESGEKLGEVKTDKEGKFSFPAKYYCNHVLTVDSGDGHQAEWLVSKSELSTALPGLPSETGSTNNDEQVAESKSEQPAVASGDNEVMTAVSASLADEVKRLSSQIIIMREELDAFREEIRLRDVLGGIGFLFGVSGIAFYFLAKKQKRETFQ